MESDNQEAIFLRQQIEKLSSLLHDYQEKYPPLSEEDRKNVPSLVTPPWHVDPKLVSPLLVEYEASVTRLTTELDKYKHQYKSLQKEVDQLISENDRLTTQLQQTLEDRLPTLSAATLPIDSELTAIDNLQAQLSLVSQEKDALNDLLRGSQREVVRLEEELSELRQTNISNSHWQHLQSQHQQTKAKFSQTITELNHELRLAREEARRCRNETEMSEQKLLDYKRSLSHIKDDHAMQERSKLISAQETIRGVELQLEAKSKELADVNMDVDTLNDLVDSQLDQIKKLSKICKEKESQLQVSAERVKEAIQVSEEAVLEKTEMALALKNYQSEVDRLRQELSSLCDQAGKKTKDEVDKVQSYNNLKIKKLNDSLQLVESENGSLKAELERVVREKRAVEAELEKVYQEGINKAYEDGGRYDQLSKRACEAEWERDEMKGKLRNIDAELKRTEMRLANEKLTMSRDNDRLTERLSALQKDFKEVNEDRLRHLQEAHNSEELANSMRREAEAAERKHSKEMMCMEHSLSQKQTEFEIKLRAIEESHRKLMNKLQEEITSQQRSTNQWKDEYHMLSEKWEKTVQSLRTSCSEKETRIDELTSLLREARDKTIEAETMMKDYTNQMRKIELRTKESEKQAAEALAQNTEKDRKIRRLLMEKQQLAMSSHLQDSNLKEATFRMSEMGENGYAARSPAVLDELSLNIGASTRSRFRGSQHLTDLLDDDFNL
ncbi:sodium channel and clathrin linker 1-like [Watersipora subatra]|uniref:sodium channel and clathrin linker 1-like n=1 Tax=Watersipora subatra TaxID=2589382 RepID=UPI00355BC20F